MPICREEGRKLKYASLKYCTNYNAETNKVSKIYRATITQMPKCRDKESKVKYTELTHCRFQYAETIKAKKKTKKKTEKWNTIDVNMQRQGKQSQICRTEILQLSTCRDKESKLKYTELKDCRF